MICTRRKIIFLIFLPLLNVILLLNYFYPYLFLLPSQKESSKEAVKYLDPILQWRSDDEDFEPSINMEADSDLSDGVYQGSNFNNIDKKARNLFRDDESEIEKRNVNSDDDDDDDDNDPSEYQNRNLLKHDIPNIEYINEIAGSDDEEPNYEQFLENFGSDDNEPNHKHTNIISEEDNVFEPNNFFNNHDSNVPNHFLNNDDPSILKSNQLMNNYKNPFERRMSFNNEPNFKPSNLLSMHKPLFETNNHIRKLLESRNSFGKPPQTAFNKKFHSQRDDDYLHSGEDEDHENNMNLEYLNKFRRRNKNWPHLQSLSVYGNVDRKHMNWQRETFCYQYLVETFRQTISVCRTRTSSKTAECFGNGHDHEMATCTLRNVAINPISLASLILRSNDKTHSVVREHNAVVRLDDMGTGCDRISSYVLQKHVAHSDYINLIIETLKQESSENSDNCDKWVQGNIFLFRSHENNMYYRFLDYFNMHKILEDFSSNSEDINIIRVAETGYSTYMFPEFDQKLFHEAHVQALNHFNDGTICFQKLTLVPRSFNSLLLRCKTANLVAKCLECDGKGLVDTQFSAFRTRVLKACSIDEVKDSPIHRDRIKITVLSHKSQVRRSEKMSQTFPLVLENEADMVTALQTQFIATVETVLMEQQSICQQVKLAHASDVLIGVHGADLVHLWWLKDDALVYELKPTSERGASAYHILAKLTGHKYMRQSVSEGMSGKMVKVDIDKLVSDMTGFFDDTEESL